MAPNLSLSHAFFVIFVHFSASWNMLMSFLPSSDSSKLKWLARQNNLFLQ